MNSRTIFMLTLFPGIASLAADAQQREVGDRFRDRQAAGPRREPRQPLVLSQTPDQAKTALSRAAKKRARKAQKKKKERVVR